MKWRLWILRVAAILLLTVVPVATVIAGTVADVTLFATPLFTNGITSFTITYISETQLKLDWTVGANVTNVMIRAKYGQYPANITSNVTPPTDGYLVYYGSALSANDTSMDFDANPGPIYYRAWAELAPGVWVINPYEGWKESAIVTLLAVFGLAGVMSFLAYRSSYYLMKLLAGVSWIGAMIYWINNPPSSVVAGSPSQVVVMYVLGICGAAFILWPFLTTRKGGNEEGASFRINVDRLFGREEDEPRTSPSRETRVAAYRERLRRADNGER